MVMLLNTTPNKIISEHALIISFSHNHSKQNTPTEKTKMQSLCFTVLFSVKCVQFQFTHSFCNSKIFSLNTIFIIMRNKNRRSWRVEVQSSDRENKI